MEKNRVLNHSISHSPSLLDAPETEAAGLWNYNYGIIIITIIITIIIIIIIIIIIKSVVSLASAPRSHKLMLLICLQASPSHTLLPTYINFSLVAQTEPITIGYFIISLASNGPGNAIEALRYASSHTGISIT